MARFSFLDDGFRGKVGPIVGYEREGELFIRRYTKPTDRNSAKQQEIRQLFRHLAHLGLQITPMLSKLLPDIPAAKQVGRFIHRNKAMFDKSFARKMDNGLWSRWHPELLKLVDTPAPTLPPLVITQAEITLDEDDGTPTIEISGTAHQSLDDVCVLIYDDDTDIAEWYDELSANTGPRDPSIPGAQTPAWSWGPETIASSANSSTYKHVHVYAFYAVPNPARAGRLMVSRLAYAPVKPPAKPAPKTDAPQDQQPAPAQPAKT